MKKTSMLIQRKATVDEEKSLFGDEYNDYNLVFCSPIGRPMESQVITHMLKDLSLTGASHRSFYISSQTLLTQEIYKKAELY